MEALQYDFMRNALIAGLLASIACGIIGSFVVINRIVSISGSIAHAAYGGVGLGYLCGFNPIFGAMAFGLGSSVLMGLVERKGGERTDTAIGAIWSVGMALGIVFVDLSKGYASDLMSYLFGSILTISPQDVKILLILDLAITLLVLAFYKGFLAISFDRDYAETLDLPVNALYFLLLILIALSVVMLMRLVGLIMVIALLSMPSAISSHFAGDLKTMIALSTILGCVFTICGLFLSYYLNITSGATIILICGLGYTLALLWDKLRVKA